MIAETQKEYGKLSSIFVNGRYPPAELLPPAPEQPWTDENDPGSIQRELMKQRVAYKVRQDGKIEELKPSLYGMIKKHLSQSSMTQVKRHIVQEQARDDAVPYQGQAPNDNDEVQSEVTNDANDGEDEPTFVSVTARNIWDDFEVAADPLKLWKAIKSTHQTSRLLSSRLDQDKAMTN